MQHHKMCGLAKRNLVLGCLLRDLLCVWISVTLKCQRVHTWLILTPLVFGSLIMTDLQVWCVCTSSVCACVCECEKLQPDTWGGKRMRTKRHRTKGWSERYETNDEKEILYKCTTCTYTLTHINAHTTCTHMPAACTCRNSSAV